MSQRAPVVAIELEIGSLTSASTMSNEWGPRTSSLPTNGWTCTGSRGSFALPEPQSMAPAPAPDGLAAAAAHAPWKAADWDLAPKD